MNEYANFFHTFMNEISKCLYTFMNIHPCTRPLPCPCALRRISTAPLRAVWPWITPTCFLRTLHTKFRAPKNRSPVAPQGAVKNKSSTRAGFWEIRSEAPGQSQGDVAVVAFLLWQLWFPSCHMAAWGANGGEKGRHAKGSSRSVRRLSEQQGR